MPAKVSFVLPTFGTMRKALRVLSVCSIVAIVFSSCTSSNPLSFNKRKYTPGYFANPAGSVETVTLQPKPEKNKVAVNTMQEVKQLVTVKSLVQKQPQADAAVDKKVSTTAGPLNIKESEIFAKSKRSDNYYSVEDTIEQYNKDKKVNSILGVSSLVVGLAGIILLVTQVLVFVAIALIVISFVLSAMGIRRGSSSLFTLFGFIVSIIGVVILFYLLIELAQ